MEKNNKRAANELVADWNKSRDDLIALRKKQAKEYLGQFHRSVEGLGPSLTLEQVDGIKSVLNARGKVTLFSQLCREAEWSKDLEGLKREEEILASIVNDDSVRKSLLEAILDAYTNSNKVAAVTAKIRNETYRDDVLDTESEFQERYEKAVEESGKEFEVSREYSKMEKLFGLGQELPYGYRGYYSIRSRSRGLC